MASSVEGLTYGQIFQRVSEGEKFCCPKCNEVLLTVPEVLEKGKRPLGLYCPKNKDHYYLYAEDTERVNKMRDVLNNLASKK